MDSLLPTESLTIENRDAWEVEARAFAEDLIAKGERPWFEIRWPAPTHLSAADAHQWLVDQEEVFDAVELIDGQFVTLPPYAELRGEA